MSDDTSAASCADIIAFLAKGFDKLSPEVQKDRKKIAARVRVVFAGCDFNDDSLDCYDELVTLGLAKRCKLCGRGFTDWSRDDHGAGLCDEATP